jgi:hypothetical protein
MLECCLPDDGHEKLLKHVVGDNELNAHCSGDVFCVVTIDSHCLTQQNDFTKGVIFVDDIIKSKLHS